MLGTSDAWSTSHLSQQPSKPAYYIVDCQILHASISSISLESWGHWPDQAKPTLENENMIALQGPPIWEKKSLWSRICFIIWVGLFQIFYKKIEQKNLVKSLTYKNVKFIYSEKTTKFCEISTLLLTGTT